MIVLAQVLPWPMNSRLDKSIFPVAPSSWANPGNESLCVNDVVCINEIIIVLDRNPCSITVRPSFSTKLLLLLWPLARRRSIDGHRCSSSKSWYWLSVFKEALYRLYSHCSTSRHMADMFVRYLADMIVLLTRFGSVLAVYYSMSNR